MTYADGGRSVNGLDRWRRLDEAVTSYMLGEIDGAAISRIQHELRESRSAVQITITNPGWRCPCPCHATCTPGALP